MINYHTIINKWLPLSEILKPIKNQKEYDKLVNLADNLMTEINRTNDGIKEQSLNTLLDIVGDLIGNYEDKKTPEPDNVTPIEILKELMAEHSLKQKDLVELGSKGVISEIMNSKRELNKRQIEELSKRFNVSTDVFF